MSTILFSNKYSKANFLWYAVLTIALIATWYGISSISDGSNGLIYFSYGAFVLFIVFISFYKKEIGDSRSPKEQNITDKRNLLLQENDRLKQELDQISGQTSPTYAEDKSTHASTRPSHYDAAKRQISFNNKKLEGAEQNLSLMSAFNEELKDSKDRLLDLQHEYYTKLDELEYRLVLHEDGVKLI